MKPSEYTALEKDFHFKKSYLKGTPWWRTFLLIAPACILFVGLAGLLYLYHSDRLASLYVIPYLLLFVAGTIWLKAVRRHIQKTAMAKEGAYQICLAKPIKEFEGYIYTIFVNNARRHDKNYIAKLMNDIDIENIFMGKQGLAKKNTIAIHDDSLNIDYYMRAYFNNDITKRNPDWRDNEYFPVLFIDEKYTPIIRKIDLM